MENFYVCDRYMDFVRYIEIIYIEIIKLKSPKSYSVTPSI